MFYLGGSGMVGHTLCLFNVFFLWIEYVAKFFYELKKKIWIETLTILSVTNEHGRDRYQETRDSEIREMTPNIRENWRHFSVSFAVIFFYNLSRLKTYLKTLAWSIFGNNSIPV